MAAAAAGRTREMKKSVKRLALGVGSAVVLSVLLLGPWIYRVVADMRAMTPAETLP